MNIYYRYLLCVCLLLVISCPLHVCAAADEAQVNVNDSQQDFSRTDNLQLEKKGNILNIILDKSPELSTQRGTLVIEAFLDGNNNKIWDGNESDLKNEIVCTIDKVKYSVPAFIPALDYNARYEISCSGLSSFQPTIDQKNVLIARRGQIINMTIPCSTNAN